MANKAMEASEYPNECLTIGDLVVLVAAHGVKTEIDCELDLPVTYTGFDYIGFLMQAADYRLRMVVGFDGWIECQEQAEFEAMSCAGRA
jgi:hypothetical protein